MVADRGASREEAYILLSIIGEVRVGHIAAPGDGDTADRASSCKRQVGKVNCLSGAIKRFVPGLEGLLSTPLPTFVPEPI
jgi:hypothetical protein